MPSDYHERRHYRKLDRLINRVMQLDEILHKGAVFDDERARDLQEQIRHSQRKLTVLYDKLDLSDAPLGGRRR